VNVGVWFWAAEVEAIARSTMAAMMRMALRRICLRNG
jgi:hypothetical protein